MSRMFDMFPDEKICPICGTSEQKPCTLIPIQGTEDGNIIEAVCIHVDCLNWGNMVFNRNVGVVYIVADKGEDKKCDKVPEDI